MIVGGNFTQFNGLSRLYVARLQGASLAEPLRFTAIDSLPTEEIRLTLTGQAGQKYVVEASEDLSGWIPVSTGIAPAATFDLSIAKPFRSSMQFYRAVSVP